jgi:hypothetical protein
MWQLVLAAVALFIASIVLFIGLCYNMYNIFEEKNSHKVSVRERVEGMSDTNLQTAYAYYKLRAAEREAEASVAEVEAKKEEAKWESEKCAIMRDMIGDVIDSRTAPSEGKGGNRDIVPPEIPSELDKAVISLDDFTTTFNKVLFYASFICLGVSICLFLINRKFSGSDDDYSDDEE